MTNTMKTLLVILALVIVGGGGWYYYENYYKKPTPTPTVTPSTKEPTTTTTKDETADWKTYTNEKYGYSLKYPKDWEYKENMHEGYEKGAIVGFRKPPTKDEGFYDIVIRVADAGNTLTIDEWLARNAKPSIVTSPTHKTIGVDKLPGVEFIESNMDEHKAVYLAHNKLVMSFTIAKDSKYLSIFNKMLSTFKFTP